MIDTNELRAVWCDDETSHLVTDPEALYWSDSVAVAVLCDEIDLLRKEVAAWKANVRSLHDKIEAALERKGTDQCSTQQS